MRPPVQMQGALIAWRPLRLKPQPNPSSLLFRMIHCKLHHLDISPRLIYHSSLYEEVLFIYVGPKRVVFGVHKGLLCRESKYFQAAFNGSFSETEKGSIELPEEEPVVSDIVYTWLYSTKLAQPLDGKNLNCNVYTLVDLFIFGDKYDMPALCNRVMDQFSHVANLHKQLPANLCHIYNNTPKGSPLRRAISAMLVKYPAGLKYLCDEEAELFLTCPEFLLDLTKVLATKGAQTWCHKPNIMSLQPNPCEFHRHEDGEHERCYALTSNNL